MRFLTLVAAAPLLAQTQAYVLPDQEVFSQIAIEDNEKPSSWSLSNIYDSVKDEIKDTRQSFKSRVKSAKHVVHSTLDAAFDAAAEEFNHEEPGALSWIDDTLDRFLPGRGREHRDGPPHSKPPHEGPPHHGPPRDGPPHHGPPPPHHGPHGRHGHHKPNKTVYELINDSKYTTTLAKLINKYPELVDALNGTIANYTVFAPTNEAFEKAKKHHPDHEPSKEELKALLTYHVSAHFYPAGRVLHSYTIPTLLASEELAEKPLPQRLAVKFTLRGLTLNYYARIVAVDIFGTNGVVHGIDSILVPPPRIFEVVDRLPGEFSTLELALLKTGLAEDIAKHPVKGGTLFAPSNWAFARLPVPVNAFLFSPRGLKYLKALIKYHVVPKTTLYSDALYISTEDKDETEVICLGGGRHGDHRPLHLDLPTLLEDHSLSVDVIRTGPFVSIIANGAVSAGGNGVAKDGVIQVVNRVIIPPRHPGDHDEATEEDDSEITVEELKERLVAYVE